MRRQTRLTILLFCVLAVLAAERAFATIEITVGCTSALTGPSAFGVGHLFRGIQKASTSNAADCDLETFSTEGLTLDPGERVRIEQSFFFPISVPPPTPVDERADEVVDPSIRVLLLGPVSRLSE